MNIITHTTGTSLLPKQEPFNLTDHCAKSGFHLWLGQKWHRKGFTAEMLPAGWRPLLKDEILEEGDCHKFEAHKHSEAWRTTSEAGYTTARNPKHLYRTRRPLPLPPGWHAHDGGPCPVKKGTRGKVRFRDGEFSTECDDLSTMRWTKQGTDCDIIAYCIITPAPVEDIETQVCADIKSRQEKGIAKYGTTVAANKAEMREWLKHTYEELLDAAIYLKRAMSKIGEDGK